MVLHIRVQSLSIFTGPSLDEAVNWTQNKQQWRQFVGNGALTMDAMKGRHVHATTLSTLCHVPGLNQQD